MNRNVSEIKKILNSGLIGKTIEILHPEGHGVGGPIEQLAFSCLNAGWKKQSNRRVYSPHDFWNNIIRSYPKSKGEDRIKLLDPVQRHLAITRRSQVLSDKTDGCSTKIEPSQCATADFITFDIDKPFRKKLIIGDFKSTKDKSGDSNNLVSYAKIDKMCDLMLEQGEFNSIDFIYVGIHYQKLDKNCILVDKVYVVDLFLENPAKFRLNPAQRQIQSTVSKWTQDFVGDRRDWCLAFKSHLASVQRKWKDQGVS